MLHTPLTSVTYFMMSYDVFLRRHPIGFRSLAILSESKHDSTSSEYPGNLADYSLRLNCLLMEATGSSGKSQQKRAPSKVLWVYSNLIIGSKLICLNKKFFEESEFILKKLNEIRRCFTVVKHQLYSR